MSSNNLDLLGVNLAGAEFGSVGQAYGTGYTYPTHAEIDYEAASGMNVVRLPFLWERLQPTLNGPLDSAELARIDDVVNYATAKGLKVDLDLHDYGSYNGQQVGSAAVPNTAFADVWSKLAGHFKSNGNVLFGLMNEPQQSSASGWLDSVNAAIAGIRATGATQEILVPGIGWDGAWTWTTGQNASVIGAGVQDPLKNYAFEVHQYLDSDGSGTHAAVVSSTIGSQRLAAVTSWAQSTGNRLFMGEFGTASDSTSTAALGDMLSYMSQHSDVWQGGTYWAAGPWWGDYMYSAEPANGQDKPQMKVLETYRHKGTTASTDAATAAGTVPATPPATGGGTTAAAPASAAATAPATTGSTPTTTGSTAATTGSASLATGGTGSTTPATTPTTTPATTPATTQPASTTTTSTTIGSGPDQLTLLMSQDAYQGDAQYTVSVDGQQIGGTLTAHASHSAGQDDTLMVQGNWATGNHTVAVNFLNDLYGGTSATDRNLYVDGASYDGAAVAAGRLSLMGSGSQSFGVRDDGRTTPAGTSTTLGSGPDHLVLLLSEDPYAGDAQYTVSVDGKQVGGTLTSSANHGSGQHDTLVLNGDWGTGGHTVSIDFLNDLYGGTSATDRNLYVDGATLDGTAVAGTPLSLTANGAQSLRFRNPAPTAQAASPVGSGPDRLTLLMSEDDYKGDAQYTVSVDGQQIGGVLTAKADHGAGLHDTVTVAGNWAAGNHTVAVNFLNDLYGGTSGADRNLYVDAASYDGAAVAGGHLSLMGAGGQSFAVQDDGRTTPAGTSATVGTGPNHLVLLLTEDPYQGDAQYTVSVDGKQVGGTLTATANRGSGQQDTLTVDGSWATGNHTVAINFLNDAYGGSSGADRNLYVEGASLDGTAVSGGRLSLMANGSQGFGFHPA